MIGHKNTNDLTEELTSAPDLSIFLSDNRENFVDMDLCTMLQMLFQKSGLTKAELAKRAGTSDAYLHQLFSGIRTPSRDRLICLCFGLSATLDDAQELLMCRGFVPLYAKNRRDAIIMYGLTHEMALTDINDSLFSENEATLC